MHTWLPSHVEIPAEHPVVYADYAWSNFFHNCKLHYQAYEQMHKVLQGHWELMTICQYRCHNIIHVNARCFSLHLKCFHEIMTGMGSFLTTVNKLITLYTHGACISCVLFTKSVKLTKPSTKYNDTIVRHHHQTQLRETAAS